MVAAGLVMIALANAGSLDMDAEKDYARAQELFRQGLERQALLSLADFTRRFPLHAKMPEARLTTGELYFRDRKWNEAIREALLVLKEKSASNDERARATLLVGDARYGAGQLEDALIEYEALLRRYPASPVAVKAKEQVARVKTELGRRKDS